MTGDTGQHGAAVVDLADNKSTDKCQQGVLRQRTPQDADLSDIMDVVDFMSLREPL